MTKIIDWRRQVLSELPIDEDIFVEKYLIDAIQDLCRKTSCYTENIADTSVATQGSHTLTITTANASLIRFLYGKYKTITLEAKTRGEMTQLNSKWEEADGTPIYTVYDGGNSVRWSKKPDTTGDAVEFTVAIMPTSIENSDIPTPIENEHLETVKDYVKWKYYLQPQAFNEKLAMYHQKRYEAGRGKLRISVLTGFSGNSQVQHKSFV